jgi:hypothetical protein
MSRFSKLDILGGWSFRHSAESSKAHVLIVRTALDPATMMNQVRREVWSVDSGIALASALGRFWLISRKSINAKWWPGTGSNRRRRPFQGRALPLSYLASSRAGRALEVLFTLPSGCRFAFRSRSGAGARCSSRRISERDNCVSIPSTPGGAGDLGLTSAASPAAGHSLLQQENEPRVCHPQ